MFDMFFSFRVTLLYSGSLFFLSPVVIFGSSGTVPETDTVPVAVVHEVGDKIRHRIFPVRRAL